MKNKPRWSFGSIRGWHLWVSIALSLPILIVALTAILIAHNRALGLKDIEIDASWLPGMTAAGIEEAEPRALWVAPDGTHWFGTRMGLYRVRGETVRQVEGIGRADVRALHAAGAHLLAGTNRGLYRVAPDTGASEQVADGDFWSVSEAPGGLLAVGKFEQLLLSTDRGANWQTYEPGARAIERIAAGIAPRQGGGMPLSKVVMDLHTGKALLGRQYEWFWIDLIGAAMALLTITGLMMWWRGQRRKASALQNQEAASLPAAAAPRTT
jgi:hypothetical protein